MRQPNAARLVRLSMGSAQRDHRQQLDDGREGIPPGQQRVKALGGGLEPPRRRALACLFDAFSEAMVSPPGPRGALRASSYMASPPYTIS